MTENTYKGKECVKGHGPLRYKASNACVECAKIAARARYHKDPQGHTLYKRALRAKKKQNDAVIFQQYVDILNGVL